MSGNVRRLFQEGGCRRDVVELMARGKRGRMKGKGWPVDFVGDVEDLLEGEKGKNSSVEKRAMPKKGA